MGYVFTAFIFGATATLIVSAYEVMPEPFKRKIDAFIDEIGGVEQ